MVALLVPITEKQGKLYEKVLVAYIAPLFIFIFGVDILV